MLGVGAFHWRRIFLCTDASTHAEPIRFASKGSSVRRRHAHVDGGTREHGRDLPTLFGRQKHRRIIAGGCKYHDFPNQLICRKLDANDDL
jgi:hypothetical protein